MSIQIYRWIMKMFRKSFRVQYIFFGFITADRLLFELIFLSASVKEDTSNALHFNSMLLPAETQTTAYPLYPYNSDKLSVIFVYGEDLTREMNIVLIPELAKILAILIVLFMSLAAFLLSFMRKMLKIRGDSFITSLIDTLITFIAGGNLRMQHKYEKWLFGILLFSAFFIISIFSGGLLFYTYRILNQEMNTFNQLAEINAPIFINPSLKAYRRDIRGMLRFN